MSWFSKRVLKPAKKKLKKVKLKNILDNDLVQGAAVALSGGSLAPAIAGYRAASKGWDSLGLKDVAKKIKGSLPKELQTLKAADLVPHLVDGASPTEAFIEEVARSSGFVPAASVRGGLITISAASPRGLPPTPPSQSPRRP